MFQCLDNGRTVGRTILPAAGFSRLDPLKAGPQPRLAALYTSEENRNVVYWFRSTSRRENPGCPRESAYVGIAP